MSMSSEQRDKILELTKLNYTRLGCEFREKTKEDLIEYLFESQHGDEIRCLQSAIDAHNMYNSDDLTYEDFFDWHGL